MLLRMLKNEYNYDQPMLKFDKQGYFRKGIALREDNKIK